MARSFCGIWLKGCALALLLGNAILPALASAQAPTYITQWAAADGGGKLILSMGVAADASGNVYVLDHENRVLTFTSTGGYLDQWGLININASYPPGIAVDGAGDVYVTRNIVHPFFGGIDKYTSAGVYIGWGAPLPPDSPTHDGRLGSPNGVATDASGNVYVADTDYYRIQKFTNTGVYITQWGSQGSGDGQFLGRAAVAVDAAGDVYVVNGNRVQKFTSTGTYLTQWGSEGSGDGQFFSPLGVATDGSGNVYVVDTGNNRIQMFTSSGGYIAQWGIYGSGNGEFAYPCAVATDALGNVYVADRENHRIQKFGHVPTPAKATTWGRLKRMYR